MHYIYMCGAIAASPINSMEVLSDCRNDFILLLLLEALFVFFTLLFSLSPPKLEFFFFFFLTLWAAEESLNWSLDLLN